MYLAIAVIILMLLLRFTKGNYPGSAILAFVWPVLIPAGTYFTVKKFVFKRHGPSPKYFELEMLGILAVTAAGLILWRFPQIR